MRPRDQNGRLDPDELARVPGVEVTIASRDGWSQSATGLISIPGVPDGPHELTVVAATLPPYYRAPAAVPVVTPLPPGEIVPVPLALPIGTNTPNLYMSAGDSISEGSGSSDGLGYRGGLEDRLRAHLDVAEVVYRGPGGGRSELGASRVAADLESVRPAYTLIMWGTNDWYDGRCHPAASCFTVPSLRQMVQTVRGHGSLPCLATIPPVNVGYDARVPPERDTWVAEIDEQIRALAREEQVLLVDVQAALVAQPNRASLFDDHVHPNDAGYEVIARTFFEALTQPNVNVTGSLWDPPALYLLPAPGSPLAARR